MHLSPTPTHFARFLCPSFFSCLMEPFTVQLQRLKMLWGSAQQGLHSCLLLSLVPGDLGAFSLVMQVRVPAGDRIQLRRLKRLERFKKRIEICAGLREPRRNFEANGTLRTVGGGRVLLWNLRRVGAVRGSAVQQEPFKGDWVTTRNTAQAGHSKTFPTFLSWPHQTLLPGGSLCEPGGKRFRATKSAGTYPSGQEEASIDGRRLGKNKRKITRKPFPGWFSSNPAPQMSYSFYIHDCSVCSLELSCKATSFW